MSDTRLAQDVITTAIEGGITYWAQVTAYKPALAYAEIIEIGDGDRCVAHTITHETVTNAVALLRKAPVAGLHAKHRTALLRELSKPVAEQDIDAVAADCLIQIGLFSRVIYS